MGLFINIIGLDTHFLRTVRTWTKLAVNSAQDAEAQSIGLQDFLNRILWILLAVGAPRDFRVVNSAQWLRSITSSSREYLPGDMREATNFRECISVTNWKLCCNAWGLDTILLQRARLHLLETIHTCNGIQNLRTWVQSSIFCYIMPCSPLS
jgi:hypothetical protein